MPRPVTLFTGQRADPPFEDVCRPAAGWGYDGLEIAGWGDHVEVDRAPAESSYVDGRRAILAERRAAAELADTARTAAALGVSTVVGSTARRSGTP